MEDQLINQFKKVREASYILSSSTEKERKDALQTIACYLNDNKDQIFFENKKDVENAKESGCSDAILHRLVFNEEKLESVTKGLEELSHLPDPIGKIKEERELDSSFILEKKTFPIGVIGMIFESRPDALVQIAGLSLMSGNGLILKGGKEAILTNRIFLSLIKKATSSYSFKDDWIMGIESHEEVGSLLRARCYVDLLIPRGSNAFVKYCMENSTIPVMGHADGICHTYIDKDADIKKALKISLDAKKQYPAACNATETFLVHRDISKMIVPLLGVIFNENGIKMHVDKSLMALVPDSTELKEEDYHKEYLSLECNISLVDSLEGAVKHINEYGSHHTDAIITENKESGEYFVSNTDSADVFINCSTRFADGFRFGLGAEVGISTSKLHARGPVGLDGLMTTKWILHGNGETVNEYSNGTKEFHHKELKV